MPSHKVFQQQAAVMESVPEEGYWLQNSANKPGKISAKKSEAIEL